MVSLLEDVRKRLESIAAIAYIDEDWGQLDDFSPAPPVKWPCALVDIVEATPSNLGNRVQLLDAVVLVRLADTRLSKTSQLAPMGQRTNANSFVGLAQTVFQKLHGWHEPSSHYGTITRTGLRRVWRDDGIREYQLRFTTQLIDANAQPVINDLSPDVQSGHVKPEVSVETN